MNDARPAPARPTAPRLRPGPTLVLLVLLLASLLLGVGLGSVPIAPADLFAALRHGLAGAPLAGLDVIVWEVRLPRVATGLLVGAILAACGAAFQGLFRNPLADPYLMGVASGAYLGITVATVLGVAAAVAPLVGMAGALASVAATLLLARRGAALPPTRLILAGVVVGSVLTALSTYLLLNGQDRVRQVFTSTLGNLALTGWPEVRALLGYALVGVAPLLLLARALGVLSLGDATARTLGVPVDALRLAVVVCASVATSAAVGFAGIIGFVGLITPHIVRRVWGADPRVLLPVSCVAGGALLVLADLLARVVTRPAELPVGVVTTLLGGPFFLYLLRRSDA